METIKEFRYKAKSSSGIGSLIDGTIKANSIKSAAKKIRRLHYYRGLYNLLIEEIVDG